MWVATFHAEEELPTCNQAGESSSHGGAIRGEISSRPQSTLGDDSGEFRTSRKTPVANFAISVTIPWKTSNWVTHEEEE